MGAYVIACQICGADTGTLVSALGAIESASFETMEDVDDINLQLKDASVIYIQAKAVISLTLAEGGELRGVLDQFRRQRRRAGDRLVLVTTSRSSKRVIYDLRSALEAYRSSEEAAFYKTQPNALSSIIDQVKATLQAIGTQDDIAQIIKAMSVLVLDIEENDPLEQAMVLLLNSSRFMAPSAIWGKLVSDCVTFAKSRRVVLVAEIEKSYERFIRDGKEPDRQAAGELIRIETEGDLSVAREIVLCESDGRPESFPEGLYIIEFYRFDDDCSERIRFHDAKVILGNGAEMKLLRRSATFDGMTRLLERDEAILQQREVTFIPANIDDDIEQSPCAKIHRQRMEDATAAHENPLTCLHCGRPTFSSSAHSIELPPITAPKVGLVHDECLQPADRIIGTIKNDLFDAHAELIDFDVMGWFKAVHGGQMVFANTDYIAGSQRAQIMWGGGEAKGPLGNFVVEISLLNGEREIVTKRNGVQRFSKEKADAFVERLNKLFTEQRGVDPYVYSDETKSFGRKSVVLGQIGMKEKLRPVDHARTREYDAAFAERYSRPGSWYAPLLYLRSSKTGEPVSEHKTVLFLTNPLALKSFLDNWKEAQIAIEEYRTETLLTDDAFDDFMRWNEGRGYTAVVNPIIDPATGELASGRPIISLDLLLGLLE